MVERLRIESNERVDIDDFKHLAGDTAVGRTEQLLQSFVNDATDLPMSVIHGFKPEFLSTPSRVKVTRGAALLGYRSGSSVRTGVITAQGAASTEINVSAYGAGLYGIYIRFEEVAVTPESRLFWDSTGLGSEYAQTIETRFEAQWGIRIELASPGSEWHQIGTYNTVGTVVTDTRVFYFEGDTANTYESGWSTDGGGGANDRNADRGTYGVGSLAQFVSATKQCLEDIKGRGLSRWWDRFIGGMNIGFDADPVAGRLAVGDSDFALLNTGIGIPYLVFDVDGVGASWGLLYHRSSETFSFMFEDLEHYLLDDSAFYPGQTGLDLGSVANEWDTSYVKNGIFSEYITVKDSDFRMQMAGSIIPQIIFDDVLGVSFDLLGYDRNSDQLYLAIDGDTEHIWDDTGYYPYTTDSLNLGGVSNRWDDLHVRRAFLAELSVTTGSADFPPAAASTYDLGTVAKPWNELHIINIFCQDIACRNIAPTSGIYELGDGTNDWHKAYIRLLKLKEIVSDPSGPEKGDVYYNSTSDKLMVYTGSTFETVTSS